jgi:hypothetical protein
MYLQRNIVSIQIQIFSLSPISKDCKLTLRISLIRLRRLNCQFLTPLAMTSIDGAKSPVVGFISLCDMPVKSGCCRQKVK